MTKYYGVEVEIKSLEDLENFKKLLKEVIEEDRWDWIDKLELTQVQIDYLNIARDDMYDRCAGVFIEVVSEEDLRKQIENGENAIMDIKDFEKVQKLLDAGYAFSVKRVELKDEEE